MFHFLASIGALVNNFTANNVVIYYLIFNYSDGLSSDEEDSLLKELNLALETDTESWEDCKVMIMRMPF